MAYEKNEQLLKLEDAVQKCKHQGQNCLWHTEGLSIKYDGTLPENSIVSLTSVLVSSNSNDSCLVMLICTSVVEAKTSIVAVGNFSSLEQLKIQHPQLFEKVGTLAVR